MYEVNQWFWQIGRWRPRIGGLSASETAERRDVVVSAGAKRRRQPGAEMNETYGMSASQVISQDNSV